MMKITLIGFMGCGKSSVAKELAALLCCSHTDLDDYITEKEGRSIREIFEKEGEEYFRDVEFRCLEQLLMSDEGPEVLALGGGAAIRACGLLRSSSICIYLKTSEEELCRRLENEMDKRPMLAGGQPLGNRVHELMMQRGGIYEKAAGHTVVTDGLSPREIAVKIREICSPK